MNSEINLLKVKKKTIEPSQIVNVLLILSVIGSGLFLFWTYNGLQKELTIQEEDIAHYTEILESGSVAELENEYGLEDIQSLKDVQDSLIQVQSVTVPKADLYNSVVALLDDSRQLRNFDYGRKGDVSLVISVNSLEQASTYVSILRSQPYVSSVTMNSVRGSDSEYEASLAITVNEENLRGMGEESMDE